MPPAPGPAGLGAGEVRYVPVGVEMGRPARLPVAAIAATLPGASWQRCRTHYLRDLLTKVSKASQPWVATLVRTISGQPDAAEVHAQLDHYEHCGHATACSPILAGVVLVRG